MVCYVISFWNHGLLMQEYTIPRYGIKLSTEQMYFENKIHSASQPNFKMMNKLMMKISLIKMSDGVIDRAENLQGLLHHLLNFCRRYLPSNRWNLIITLLQRKNFARFEKKAWARFEKWQQCSTDIVLRLNVVLVMTIYWKRRLSQA